MSRHVQSTIAASVVALAAFAGTASGQWSGNPAANLAIGSGPGGQETAKIASRPDGGCYVGWFDSGTGVHHAPSRDWTPRATRCGATTAS